MAKEILAIPEEHLIEVIEIIRLGLKEYPNPSKEVKEQLEKWCEEEFNYISDENRN